MFDHEWAQARERAGIEYYPAPSLRQYRSVQRPPVVGRPCRGRVELLAALPGYLQIEGLSSAHINFDDLLADTALAQQPGWMQRLGCQFHWQNRGYRDFQDFLDVLSPRSANRCAKSVSKWQGRGVSWSGQRQQAR